MNQTLKDNPSLFDDMIENGRRRREAFSEEALTKRWIELMGGPIRKRFEEWQRQAHAVRLLNVGKDILCEPFSKKVHRYCIRNGRRILDPVGG